MHREIGKIGREIIDLFHLNDVIAVISNLLILIVSFLAPIQSMLYSLLFLIIVDFITGILASIKRKIKITSSKLSRTVSKILVYLTTILVVHVANEYILLHLLPLESFTVGFIALTELKSIFENLDKISKHDFLKKLIKKLSNDGRKAKGDRK